MVFQPRQTVSLLCLILVITSIASTRVNGTTQQFESKTLSSCPITNDDREQVKSDLLQELGTLIEQLSTELIQPTTTEQTTEETTAQPTTEQTTEESTAQPTTEQTTEETTAPPTTTDPLYMYTCNGTPGWRQVVFINMTDTSYNCPPGLQLTSYSKRTCGQSRNGCSSTTFSVGGSEYSRVCGRIRGYQVGLGAAFYGYLRQSQTIDRNYMDGVSLTHGATGRRQHVWTYAIGLTELDNNILVEHKCPCDVSNPSVVSPPFVGNDYFCESGLHSRWEQLCKYCGVIFADDPLWDGQNCTSTSTCCQFNNPPWFTKNLTNTTTDDIELRLCQVNAVGNSNIALELVELYVQ